MVGGRSRVDKGRCCIDKGHGKKKVTPATYRNGGDGCATEASVLRDGNGEIDDVREMEGNLELSLFDVG